MLTLVVLGTALAASTSAQATNSDFFHSPSIIGFKDLYLDLGYFSYSDSRAEFYGDKGADYKLKFNHSGLKMGLKKFFFKDNHEFALFLAPHFDIATSQLNLDGTVTEKYCYTSSGPCFFENHTQRDGFEVAKSEANGFGLEAGVLTTVYAPFFFYASADVTKNFSKNYKVLAVGAKVGVGVLLARSNQLYFDLGWTEYGKTSWEDATNSDIYEYSNVNHKIYGLGGGKAFAITFGLSF